MFRKRLDSLACPGMQRTRLLNEGKFLLSGLVDAYSFRAMRSTACWQRLRSNPLAFEAPDSAGQRRRLAITFHEVGRWSPAMRR